MPSSKELVAATKQLRADFTASLERMGNDAEKRNVEDPTLFRMFCLGVMMCTQSLKGFVEEPEDTALLPHMTPEQSCEAYFIAARAVFYAD